MRLEGIHHITAITGDAPANVSFYAGVLGLRLVKKTVNQDDPGVYHLFYADEEGSPGADLTFFEYPGAMRGRAGDGMVHTIVSRVGSADSLDFWERRLADHGAGAERLASGGLRFEDPEGLAHELVVADVPDAPLRAQAPDIPAEHALQGFDAVRAYSSEPAASEALLRDVLGFTGGERGRWEVRGERRGGLFSYDEPPAGSAVQGAGSVHHVAFAIELGEQDAWHERLRGAGVRATHVIDRFYFRSIYFREPSGVLFELATMGPGFAADEDPDHLGERLSLPPFLESRRAEIEPRLTPLPAPRARSGAAQG